MVIDLSEFDSPIGAITFAVHAGCVCALAFTDRWARTRAALERRFGEVEFRTSDNSEAVIGHMRDYFAGDLDALASIAVDLGGTPFQRKVWSELRNIPAGHTATYRDVARAIGAPTAVRAVGAANGANPVGIIVPCHRVIGAGGQLVGYAGGVERKRWLLAHERCVSVSSAFFPSTRAASS